MAHDLITIFNAQTTNISGNPIVLNLGSDKAVITAWGTWGGATLQLQVGTIPDSGGNISWITITDRFNVAFSFTTNTQITMVEFVAQQLIRGVITNAGVSTSINCILQVT
jgi:hypothetical protein